MGHGNHSRLNMGSLMMEPEVIGSKLWLIHFYQEQLDKFAKLGLGKHTEFDVRITKELIAITQKRLDEITIIYDKSLHPRTHVLRKAKKRLRIKEKLRNGSTNSNGTAATSRMQDNGDTRHEEDKS